MGKQILKTVKTHFPDLGQQIRQQLSDHRDNRGKVYRIDEAILSVVVMFLFKEGSRNSYNQSRQERRFSKNVRNLLGIRLVHGDAFEDILRVIDTGELQALKAAMVNSLIRSGVLTPEKGLGKFVVAVDGTGLHSISENHPDKAQSLAKTSKGGITSYSLGILEAKLVTSEGLCISLCSEEIANLPEHATTSEKQDCELKAFSRLLVKLKQHYPKLPVLLVADGLYANVPVIKQLLQAQWDYMLVLKDGSQKDLQEEINLRPDRIRHTTQKETLHWISDLELGDHILTWLMHQELGHQFCWITNLEIHNANTASTLSKKGRLRWKIENEGFNVQKNHGYALQHKFSRVSFQANYNYYQCLQLAHMIEQLVVVAAQLKASIKKAKISLKTISERLKHLLIFSELNPRLIRRLVGLDLQSGHGLNRYKGAPELKFRINHCKTHC